MFPSRLTCSAGGMVSVYTNLLRPLLFRFDPERVHDTAIYAGSLLGRSQIAKALLERTCGFADPRLETEVCGIRLANPLGLAAGFDKNGRAIDAMAAIGMGHVEIGSISAEGSPGNPKPRLWRLPQDEAILVHYGLPNEGAERVAARLTPALRTVPLGVNIVKTNRGLNATPDSHDAIIADYVRSVRALQPWADYRSLNLSCPNTEMGRDFFADPAHTARLLEALQDVSITCPLFLKVSPRGGVRAIEELLQTVEPLDFVSGFIFNLAPGQPDGLQTPRHQIAGLPGSVSGKPVAAQMNACIREMYARMDRRRYRIIGAGGVFSGTDAYEKIRLGASLVQILTALVYEGPTVVKRINRELCGLLERDGLDHVADAVGAEHSAA